MRHLVAAIVFAIAGFALVSGRSADKSADFGASLDQVARMMDAHKWKEAKALLRAKLDEHAGQDYVRASLAKVRETLKRCSFEIAMPHQGLEDVFCGDVLDFDAKTGQIELRYKKSEPQQDGEAKAAEKKNASFDGCDFEKIGKESVLKLPFVGPHIVEFDGKAMDQIEPTVRLGVGTKSTYLVTYAFGNLSKIELCAGTNCQTIASSSTFSNVMRPYKIKVSVREKQIDALHNGKRIVQSDRAGPFGRFGFAQFANLEEIRVSGIADTAWITARIDERTKLALAEFEKAYDAEADLPEWLRAH